MCGAPTAVAVEPAAGYSPPMSSVGYADARRPHRYSALFGRVMGLVA